MAGTSENAENTAPDRSPSLSNSTSRSPPVKEALSRVSGGPQMGHRQSFGESFRGVPSSPRSHRQPSLSQQAVQDLLNNPPVRGSNADLRFKGRDWRTLQLGEIINRKEDLKYVTFNSSVEEATNLLVTPDSANVVLIKESSESNKIVGSFDYTDLNAYLLLVLGLTQPEEDQTQSFKELAQKGREGKPIPLRDVKDLGRKEPNITLPASADLSKSMEVFGSGIHRIIVVEEGTTDVVGILTQLRLLGFFWEHRNSFPALEPLYPQLLRDLSLGSHSVYAINGDKPLAAALELMNNEGVTSLPVLDNQRNVVGNISNVDVKLLTKSTSLPLLSSSCIHFISVILSERGVNDGKDSFPVFHVTPYSTLSHTVAKLVATKSHRMWVVDAPSPASSTPATPVTTPAVLHPPAPYNQASSAMNLAPHAPTAPAVSASALPGASLSGHLSGVVSLTDILNLFARASGLHPHDPDEMRRHRRRSSSSSMRRSVDSSRSESIAGVDGSAGSGGVNIGRSSSIAGRRG